MIVLAQATPTRVISTDDERSLATEKEWRDPDKVSPAMPIQGVLSKPWDSIHYPSPASVHETICQGAT